VLASVTGQGRWSLSGRDFEPGPSDAGTILTRVEAAHSAPAAPYSARPQLSGDGLDRHPLRPMQAPNLRPVLHLSTPSDGPMLAPILLHGEDAGAWPVLEYAQRINLDTRIGSRTPSSARIASGGPLATRSSCAMPFRAEQSDR
jgi:hypothetical protein